MVGHFHGEKEDATAVDAGGVVGEVLGEGGFTHGRAGADNHEVAFLEAGGLFVEVAEASLEAAEGAFVVVEFFHAVESVGEERL